MHHYTANLHWLGARENVVSLWRHHIPQQAFKHRFLMHGLLALGALHVAYLRPATASKYLQACDRHQAIALQKYRSILSTEPVVIDPELADALFALSAVLSLSSMARSCAVSGGNEAMDMDAVVELFIMTKGIRNVIQLCHEHVKRSPLAEMLDMDAFIEGSAKGRLPSSMQIRFAAIRDMLLTSTSGLDDPEALEDGQSALNDLEEIYKHIAYSASTGVEIQTGDISRWQVSVSMGYVRLIRARNPPALVVLAYYAAASTAIRNAWYLENWAECVLSGISLVLDEGMQHWLEWPMKQVQDRMSELGVRPSPGRDGRSEDLS
jgi:hypothetical protein